MIADVETKVRIEGNIEQGESVVMGVSPEALATITDSMINLYTNKYLAVLREYSTNARDAHIAADRGHLPIEVMLPGEFDSRLIVTDYGIGMSKDDLLKRYTQYGVTDKRGTNGQVGYYGYGCKSAFAVSDQFTVTSVKDGWKTVVLLSRDETGVGKADIISHTETFIERNGTTVTVAIPDHARMARTAEQFFHGWTEGTVLVDGDQPRSFRNHGVTVGPVTYLTKYETRDIGMDREGIYAVMGNVVYPLNHIAHSTGWGKFAAHGAVFIDTPIGAVDIVPAREGLRDSDRTIKFLTAACENFTTGIVRHVQAEADAQPSLYRAAMVVDRYESVLAIVKHERITWRRKSVSRFVKIDLPGFYIERDTIRAISDEDGLDLRVGKHETLMVTDITPEQIAKLRFGMKSIFADGGYDNIVIDPDGQYRTGWFDADAPTVHTITFDAYIEKRRELERIRRAQNPREAKPVIYRAVSIQGGKEMQAEYGVDDLLAVPQLVFCKPNRHNNLSGAVTSILGIAPDAVIVRLTSAQRPDTFIKRFPNASSLAAVATAHITAQIPTFTDAEIASFAYEGTRFSSPDEDVAKALRPELGRIENTAAAALIRRITAPKPKPTAATERYGELTALSYYVPNQGMHTLRERVEAMACSTGSLTEDFPLLRAIYNKKTALGVEHAVAYLNALHAAEQAAPSQTSAQAA